MGDFVLFLRTKSFAVSRHAPAMTEHQNFPSWHRPHFRIAAGEQNNFHGSPTLLRHRQSLNVPPVLASQTSGTDSPLSQASSACKYALPGFLAVPRDLFSRCECIISIFRAKIVHAIDNSCSHLAHMCSSPHNRHYNYRTRQISLFSLGSAQTHSNFLPSLVH